MEQQATGVRLTSFSQPHVLQYRMQKVGLKHGDTVMADLLNVRLEPYSTEAQGIYFCPMQDIKIHGIISRGDGGALPEDATLKGDWSKPKSLGVGGLFNLKNVTLHSNGTIQVIANEDTVFEPVEAAQFQPPPIRPPQLVALRPFGDVHMDDLVRQREAMLAQRRSIEYQAQQQREQAGLNFLESLRKLFMF